MKSVETPEEEFSHWYDEELHQPIQPEEYREALINEMELQIGDTYEINGEAYQVHSIDAFSGTLVVHDPTCNNPQDARAGTWKAPILDLYADWKQGKAVPAKMGIVSDA
jgi:hypothetical protein